MMDDSSASQPIISLLITRT